ncbi:hypothetical protein EIN_093440 [Entamoeba invadens IP1]|uniref:Transmembrane protein n=2 Tax=Entamoeba invadens TaxID=33085 RepID=A0A0A1TZX2_ENTIV|nr:hypothetical protein EIN_093440 [Entamoeba invadens IP1]ELP87187.1 hypothetical protein EIN_093440 [Entamoeba invadens IP1]BAN41617.1 hypothetical protein, conserved [Entamoeba invadens]BAN41852.1 hypothetical protein, conserved [Entamoeba invadens]|eukprot:XP_004253958.1 hypothetical protein EIN_093440 [Entamoeba invadens IP1]
MEHFNSFVERQFGPTIDVLENYLVNISVTSSDPLFWTVKPRSNIHQMIFAIPFCLLDLLFALIIFPKTSKEKSHNTKKWYSKYLGAFCLFCFVTQMYYKYQRRIFFTIFMPCHIILLVQAIVLFFLPQHTGFLYQCSCIPLFALVFPDTKKNVLFFEKPFYYIQHSFQFFLPIVFPLNDSKLSVRHFFGYFFFGLFLFILLAFYLCVPFSYVTGLNLSFMMFPPHSSPWQGELYRLNALVFAHYIGWVFGYVVYFMGSGFQYLISLMFHKQDKEKVKNS